MLEKLEFMIALSREQHFRPRRRKLRRCATDFVACSIQSLEEMLNTPLVKRASRFQGFTPEGERVLRWAHRLVGDARAMRQDILGLKTGIDSPAHCGPSIGNAPGRRAYGSPSTAQSEHPIHSTQSSVKHPAQDASTARDRCWRYLPE